MTGTLSPEQGIKLRQCLDHIDKLEKHFEEIEREILRPSNKYQSALNLIRTAPDLERKNPEFEDKMYNILLVYKQIEMCFDKEGNIAIDMEEPKTVTVSYDEKPGIQALKT